MKKYVPFVSLFFIFLSITFFFTFRQTPKGELWKGFSVLYVPSDTSDEQVKEILNQFDINDFTCLSNQYMPTVLAPDSAELSLIAYNANAMDYLKKRNNYFFDESYNFRLYYIPIEYKDNLASCVSFLNKNDILSGVDSSTSYPILLPVCVLVFLIMLFIFSKQKRVFLSCSVLTLFYAISFPYLSCAVSAIILLLVLFVCTVYYKRRGAAKLLVHNIILLSLLFTSIVSSFSTTLVSGLMFVLLLVGTVASYFVCDYVSEFFKRKSSFNPVPIRSAGFIPQFARKEKIIFPAALILILLVFAVSIFSVDSFSIASSNISLPSSVASSHSNALPDLEDYTKWDFVVQSFPYRSINDNQKDLYEPVVFYRYSVSGRNVIEKKENLCFDSQFIENSLAQINVLKFNAIEKILKSQDNNSTFGYSVSGSNQLSLFSIILVIVQILFMLLYYIRTVVKIHRGKK